MKVFQLVDVEMRFGWDVWLGLKKFVDVFLCEILGVAEELESVDFVV